MNVGIVIVVVLLTVAFGPIGYLFATRKKDDLTQISLDGDDLVLRPKRFERFIALRRELRIPVSGVKAVEAGPAGKPGGLRFGGTYFPGLAIAGTYLQKERTREFFNVRWNRPAVILELDPSKCSGFRKAVVGVADPEAIAVRLKSQALKFPH